MEYEEPKYKPYLSQNKPLFPKLGIQLNCPKCDASIESNDINIDKTIAKCSSCNTVFSFDEDVNNPVRRRPEIFMPEEVEMLSLRDELSIYYKWRKTRSLSPFMVFFAIAWNAFLLPFIFAAISSGSLGILLGISVHLFVGVSLLANIILTLINTTYVTVDDYELSIEHRPFTVPFLAKNKYIDTKDIKQLFVQKYSTGQTNGVHNYAYQLVAQLKNGEDVKILKGFKHQNKVLYIEQEIEIFLNIEDKPVVGEVD